MLTEYTMHDDDEQQKNNRQSNLHNMSTGTMDNVLENEANDRVFRSDFSSDSHHQRLESFPTSGRYSGTKSAGSCERHRG